MLLTVFSIYDSGVSSWMPPLYARNKGEMLRQFVEAVNTPDTKFFKHPGDYTLFEIATWNDDNCEFSVHLAPIKLGVAVEFTKAPPSV